MRQVLLINLKTPYLTNRGSEKPFVIFGAVPQQTCGVQPWSYEERQLRQQMQRVDRCRCQPREGYPAK
jgi:hypothetical protein